MSPRARVYILGFPNGKCYVGITVKWDQAADLEVWWISRLDTLNGLGYNMTAGGDGSVGLKHTNEARAKMSSVRRGRKLTAEHRAEAAKENHVH